MNFYKTKAHDFLANGLYYTMTACLIVVLLMSQASCQQNPTDDVPLLGDADYTDVDDIDWRNFPIAETTTKSYPTIYYKEDIVSEDYDPNDENKSSSKEQETDIKPLHRRKYKDISRRNRRNRTENYRYIKPEKVFFDIFPIEESGARDEDIKYENENDIHVDVISLADNENNSNSKQDDSEESSSLKHFGKRPKKYSHRHRQRRDVDPVAEAEAGASNHPLRHKRNPYVFSPVYRGTVYFPCTLFHKYTVKGIYYNPITNVNRGQPSKTTTPPKVVTPNSIDNRINTNEITPRPSRRPAPPIIHSGDEDYMTQPSGNRNPNNRITTTRRPAQESFPQTQPTFRPTVPRTTTYRPPTTTPEEGTKQLSPCIWAISSCCTKTQEIRYQCFERLGCNGAFWDFNPCADDIYRTAVQAVDEYLL